MKFDKEERRVALEVGCAIVGMILLATVAAFVSTARAAGFNEDSNKKALEGWLALHTICEESLGKMPSEVFETPKHVGMLYAECMSGHYHVISQKIQQAIDAEYKLL